MDLSVALGSAGVSLFDLTKVFAIFPRFGRKISPIFFTKIIDRNGKLLEENKPDLLANNIVIPSGLQIQNQASPSPSASPSPLASAGPSVLPTNFAPDLTKEDPALVMDPRVAYVMTHLMKEVISFGTGHKAKSLGRTVAGKTGTTSEYVDAWFMGFSPDVVTGAWVGFDNQKTLGSFETGAKAALPIWLSYMKEALKFYEEKDFTIPPGVTFVSINPVSGKRVPPHFAHAIKEAFIEGTEPLEEELRDETTPQSQSGFLKEDIE
ncbi:MAG: hypothetical protein HY072_02930 [Deltaproteobacteria bacterium]|nr:hypothetical protein [Deltaproteobacteria bacterium]